MGELERRVMDILWDGPEHEFTGRTVADELPEFAYTTVATVLDRLVRKGLVQRRTDGRRIRFSAVGSQGAHAAVLMRQAMDGGEDADAALVSFARSLPPGQAAILRAALDSRATEPAGSPQ